MILVSSATLPRSETCVKPFSLRATPRVGKPQVGLWHLTVEIENSILRSFDYATRGVDSLSIFIGLPTFKESHMHRKCQQRSMLELSGQLQVAMPKRCLESLTARIAPLAVDLDAPHSQVRFLRGRA